MKTNVFREANKGSFDSQGLRSVGIGNIQEQDVLSTEILRQVAKQRIFSMKSNLMLVFL